MLKNKQEFMNKHKFNAFTLAEMMVVMLIMSIHQTIHQMPILVKVHQCVQ